MIEVKKRGIVVTDKINNTFDCRILKFEGEKLVDLIDVEALEHVLGEDVADGDIIEVSFKLIRAD